MAENHFFCKTFIKKIPVLGKTMFIVLLPLFASFFVHFQKLIRPHPSPLWGGRGSQKMLENLLSKNGQVQQKKMVQGLVKKFGRGRGWGRSINLFRRDGGPRIFWSQNMYFHGVKSTAHPPN